MLLSWVSQGTHGFCNSSLVGQQQPELNSVGHIPWAASRSIPWVALLWVPKCESCLWTPYLCIPEGKPRQHSRSPIFSAAQRVCHTTQWDPVLSQSGEMGSGLFQVLISVPEIRATPHKCCYSSILWNSLYFLVANLLLFSSLVIVSDYLHQTFSLRITVGFCFLVWSLRMH